MSTAYDFEKQSLTMDGGPKRFKISIGRRYIAFSDEILEDVCGVWGFLLLNFMMGFRSSLV